MRTERRCGNCGRTAPCRWVPPLALRVCASCESRWNGAHIRINADPAAREYRRRAEGDAAYAEIERRRWWAEDVKQPQQ